MSTKRTNTFEPLLEVIPFHFDNEASFREMLQGIEAAGSNQPATFCMSLILRRTVARMTLAGATI